MNQSVILAVGTNQANSSDVTVEADTAVTVGIYVASGNFPADAVLNVVVDTPGKSSTVAKLSSITPVVLINGPCAFRVQRPVVSNGIGVFVTT